MYLIFGGATMSFAVGLYKEVSHEYKLPCVLYKKKIKLLDPILFQKDINIISDISCCHLSCFIQQIQYNFPDFWKKYILEMI